MTQYSSREMHLRPIGELILEYLETHPNASDTLEGICQWWLGATGEVWAMSDVEAALAKLMDRGEISGFVDASGTTHYRRTRR